MAADPKTRPDDVTSTDNAGDDASHAKAFDDLKRRREDASASAQLFQLSGVGFEFISSVGGFVALGWWLDRKYGKSPVFMLSGLAIGFVLGLYRLVRFGMRMNQPTTKR